MNKSCKSGYFLVPYFLVFSVLSFAINRYSKGDLHLLLSSHRSPFADSFFTFWTEMGGSLPYIFIAFIFFYKYSTAFYLTFSQLLGAVFSVFLKNLFLMPRPSLYFAQNYPETLLPHVENMHLYSTHSMPSGHTITAFAFFFGIALISKNKFVRFFCFVFAALVGYSRVYLSQHFISDVLAGSLIGVLCAWILFPLYKKLDKNLKDSSLRDFFSRKNRKTLNN